MTKLFGTLALGILACAGPAQASTIAYTVTSIGSLGSSSYGYGLNDLGDAVGYGVAATGIYGIVNSGGTVTQVGTLGGTDVGGYEYSYGLAINDASLVVGSSRALTGSQHAITWQNGVITDLGTLGGAMSSATSVNNNGQIVGISNTRSGAVQAFLSDGATMTNIGSLGGGAPGRNNDYQSQATDINDAGLITGYSQATNFRRHAFIYDQGAWTDLGTLGGMESFGMAINASGQVAGYSAVAQSGTFRAFFYDNGTMVNLGADGGFQSYAYDLNDAGDVVGELFTAASQQRAFIYSGGVMTNLNELIDPTSGWVLEHARSINNSGQVVGVGQLNGRTRGFLLTPISVAAPVPEPASWALMIAGFGVLGAAMRRRAVQPCPT